MLTKAQIDWLKAHPGYARMGHVAHRVRFQKKGTLRADGTFVPAAGKTPVTDGAGSVGVGVAVKRRRRR